MLLKQWIRLIQDGSDISLENQYAGGTATDGSVTLYLGKKAPFNNFFAWMGTANTDATTMQVKYWKGNEWADAVDIMDASRGFTQSGVVQFSPNKNDKWSSITDTSDENNLDTELKAQTIYDLYWLKITFSVDLAVGTTVERIAYKFTDDYELSQKDTDVNDFLPAFGVTDWTAQILEASIEVARDMMAKGLITDEGQILRFEDVVLPATWKTLFNIYLNLGDSYAERRKEIQELYNKSFIGIYTIDKNEDGLVSKGEVGVSSNRMHR